jgi:hypothetical protein
MLRHKYGAKRCERDGIKFPSKLERGCYDVLMSQKDKGLVLFVIRQIPFDLPGGAVHKIDYCVFTKENVIFIEAKGRDLAMGKMKRLQVEELYNVTIHVVTEPSQIYRIINEEK